MNNDQFDFNTQLNEAKALLKHINESIRETRNKTYFLIGFPLAFVAFFSKSFFNSTEYKSVEFWMFIFSVVWALGVVWASRTSLSPLKLRFDGMSPKAFSRIIQDQKGNELWIKNSILHSYDKSIEINSGHLTCLAKEYHRTIFVSVVLLLCAAGFLVIERLVR